VSPWVATAFVSNGPTEAVNNLIKQIGFGFRSFANYRIRVLLYAGDPTGTYSRRAFRVVVVVVARIRILLLSLCRDKAQAHRHSAETSVNRASLLGEGAIEPAADGEVGDAGVQRYRPTDGHAGYVDQILDDDVRAARPPEAAAQASAGVLRLPEQILERDRHGGGYPANEARVQRQRFYLTE
jgi:Transposase